MTPETKPIRIPPKGTKGTEMPGGRFLMKLSRPFLNSQIARYKKVEGAEPAKFMGFPILLLTTVGAKTGNEHTHVLGGFRDGDESWLVIASKGGAPTHPHWFHNLAKNPDKVWAQVGNRRFRANVESLQGKERDDAYGRVVAVAKNYGSYLKKTDREIPVLRLTPAE
jgi:deazaflavin-dependent oxidoreductase (nitroreductase family)